MKKSLKWPIAQWFELRWWQAYLKNRPKQEYLAWKKRYWGSVLDKVRECVTIREGSSVLDAGCGPAGIFMILDQCKVDATDPLLNKYQEKIEHFDKAQYPNVVFTCSTIEDFKPSEMYDVIFCMNAINHVHNIDKCYDLLASWLKPGGIMVLTIDAHNYSFFKYLFRIVPGDLMHPYQFSLKEYDAFLTSRHFKLKGHYVLKSEFFFNHYLQIATKPR